MALLLLAAVARNATKCIPSVEVAHFNLFVICLPKDRDLMYWLPGKPHPSGVSKCNRIKNLFTFFSPWLYSYIYAHFSDYSHPLCDGLSLLSIDLLRTKFHVPKWSTSGQIYPKPTLWNYQFYSAECRGDKFVNQIKVGERTFESAYTPKKNKQETLQV